MPKLALAVVAIVFASAASAVPNTEPAFLAANRVAMDRMMAGMSPKPIGDVDADFVNMMEPHHQGAIDMAVLELATARMSSYVGSHRESLRSSGRR